MEYEIEKEITFDCPEGTFSAVLEQIKDNPVWDDGERIVKKRWVFVVEVPWIKDKIVKAGIDFDPRKRSMDAALRSWLGERLTTFRPDGKLDLKALVGQPADIVTLHQHNSRFKKPFVRIEQIRPPRSLNRTKPQESPQN
jgi:hypothetical protein